MLFIARRGVEEEKDTLKTPPIIIETFWAPGFLNIKALDEIISEPEPRRTAEGFVDPRTEGSPVARRYSLRHYRDLIMSSSFESLNLGGFAFSVSLTLLPIAGVNIFEMSYLANQGFLLISHLR